MFIYVKVLQSNLGVELYSNKNFKDPVNEKGHLKDVILSENVPH